MSISALVLRTEINSLEKSAVKECKSSLISHSADMPVVKQLRLLFYSLATLELILLTAYEVWGKAILR